MNPEQFVQFIDAKQADRAAVRQVAQVQHDQCIMAQLETSTRQQVESQAKRAPACDGNSTKSVREWIREVEFTIPYSNRTVYIAARTAEGALRREIERYLEGEPNRNAVTWAQLLTHVQTAFLSAHEADREMKYRK